MRLGIFGGSFDPVHLGHLTLATCCLRQANLQAVWFVPNARQPLKPLGPFATDDQRAEMLRLAIAGEDAFRLCTLELDRGGVSYTAETLEAIHEQHPEAELFFPMGADSLADLPHWHRASDICRLATPLIVHRAGTDKPNFELLQSIVSQDRLEQIRQSQVEMPSTSISSTEIRQRIADGHDWETMVPPQVASYIRRHQLYRQAR